MKRLGKFLRSALPADVWQIVFVAAAISLTICSRLSWFPAILFELVQKRIGESQLQIFRNVVILANLPIIFTGLSALFIGFWPGSRPVTRILLAVILPAILGFTSIFFLLAHQFASHASVLSARGSWISDAIPPSLLLLKHSTGIHFCLLGLVLMMVFVVRMIRNLSSLPLALQEPHGGIGSSWKSDVLPLVYLMVGPVFLLSGLPLSVAFAFFLRDSFESNYWTEGLLASSAIPPLLLALFLMKRQGRKIVGSFLHLKKPVYLLFALGIAVVGAMTIPTLVFLGDRAHWAAFDFRRLDPPRIASYVELPGFWILQWIVAATVEEIVFRGYLQSKFLERYGTYRGLFFVGIVWSAAHFKTDFYPPHSDAGVVMQLFYRVGLCLILSFAFGWLTLKSGTIYPAMLAHALYNVAANSRFYIDSLPFEIPWRLVQPTLWAIMTLFLFRKWPPSVEPETLPHLQQAEVAVSGDSGEMPGPLTP